MSLPQFGGVGKFGKYSSPKREQESSKVKNMVVILVHWLSVWLSRWGKSGERMWYQGLLGYCMGIADALLVDRQIIAYGIVTEVTM